MKKIPPPSRRAAPARLQQGVVLLESLIAVLLFSIAILGIVGLQALMSKGASDAQYRTEAAMIAQKRASALWAASPTFNVMGEVDTPLDGTDGLPGGLRTTTINADNTATITVTWQQPGAGLHTYQIIVAPPISLVP